MSNETESGGKKALSTIEVLAYVAASNARGLAATRYAEAKAAVEAQLSPLRADASATEEGWKELLAELGVPEGSRPRLDGDTLRW